MGYFNIAYNIFTTLYLIVIAGLPTSLTIMISGTPGNSLRKKQVERIFQVALTLFFILGTIGALFMMIFAKPLAKIMGSDSSYLCIMAISPTLFFICMSSAIRGYFQGHKNMVPTAISEITEAIGKFTIGIVLGYLAISRGESIEVAAAYAIAGITIGVAMGMIFLIISKVLYNSDKNRNCEVIALAGEGTLSTRKDILKQMIRIAVPITFSSIALNLTGIIDTFSIINCLTPAIGKENAEIAYGNYSTLAVTMAHLPSAFIQPIASSLTPTLTSALAAVKSATNSEEKSIKKIAAVKIMHSCLKFAAIISIPCAIGMSVLSKPILSLLFKNEQSVESASSLLSILAIGVFFTAMLTITTSILQSHGLQRKPIISMYSGIIIKLIANIVLIPIPTIGIYGAPIGTVIGYFAMATINFYFIIKYVGIKANFFKNLMQILFAALVSTIITILSYQLINRLGYSSIATIASIVMTAFAYFVFLFIFRAFEKNDILILPKGDKIYHALKKFKLIK